MQSDLEAFIGIPFVDRGANYQGADCWGLAVLFYRDVLGIQLPHQEYGPIDDPAPGRDAAVNIEREQRRWDLIPPGAEEFGDLVLMSCAGRWHIGVVVEFGRMLHVRRDIDSVIERYDTPRWQPRLNGFYRYV